MKNKQIFKEGDRVFDIVNGWGEVTYLYNFDWEKLALEHLACIIKFDNGKECHYTKNVALKSLSFTEYGFDERFTQERPIDYEKCIGKWGKFWNKDEKTVVIGKLFQYDAYSSYLPFGMNTRDLETTFYTNFELLTEEQTKVLGL
nr:MAG TPA: hypothetical protein [Caudoviricetes sp.]